MFSILAKFMLQIRQILTVSVLLLGTLAGQNHAVAQAVDNNIALRIYRSDGGSGTGFLVAGDDIVVTNRHVVEGAREMFILAQDGNEVRAIKAEIVRQFRTDLAVLRSSEPLDVERLTLVSTPPDAGITVTAVGFPGSARLIETSIIDVVLPSVSRGVVSRVIGENLQHDAPINPGNSGGPLLDSCEQVVGVNTFRPNDSSQGIFVAISSAQLIDALKSIGVSPTVSFSACDGGIGDILKGPAALRNILIVVVPLIILVIWLFGVPRRKSRKNLAFQGMNGTESQRGAVDTVTQYFKFGNDDNSGSSKDFEAKSSKLDQNSKIEHFVFDDEPILATGLNSRPNGSIQMTDSSGAYHEYDFYNFPKNGIKIGRDKSSNQIVIPDGSVSRSHAILRLTGVEQGQPVITIEDLGSSNGTRVDREPVIDIVEVPQSCTFRFGDAEFDVEIDGLYSDPERLETITDIHRRYGDSDTRDERFSNSVFVNNSGWLLSGIDGSGAILNIPLKSEINKELKFVLGRENSDFNIIHDSVSRRHAVICLKPGLPPTIADLGSSNGTRVNDDEVGTVPRTLYNANTIELGDLSLQLSVLAV